MNAFDANALRTQSEAQFPSFKIMAESDSESNDRLTRRRQRTTSALTDQQLQHKRNLDRKAQRALRQRTKSRIEDLEQEVEHLRLSGATQEAELNARIQTLQQQNCVLAQRLEQIGQLTVLHDMHDGAAGWTSSNTCLVCPERQCQNSPTAGSNVPASQHETPTDPVDSAIAIDFESDPANLDQHHSESPNRANATLGPRLTPETSEHISNTNPAMSQTPANDTAEVLNADKEPGEYRCQICLTQVVNDP